MCVPGNRMRPVGCVPGKVLIFNYISILLYAFLPTGNYVINYKTDSCWARRLPPAEQWAMMRLPAEGVRQRVRGGRTGRRSRLLEELGKEFAKDGQGF